MTTEEWLEALPGRIERCVALWELVLGEPLAGGSIGRVFGCTGPRGEDLVLKVSPPIAEARTEARALDHWGGLGAARLVAFDVAANALLLERIRPGWQLLEQDRSKELLSDERAVEAAAGVLQGLQSPPPPHAGAFPTFDEKLDWWLNWTAAYGEPGTAGTRMLPLMERCARALDRSATRRVLAHGDFVAKNLLYAEHGSYVAVDPLPYLGDPAADIGHFSAYHSPVETVIPRARAIAKRSGNDPDRAARWAAVWMVGEACETWREDSDDVQTWVQGTECLRLLAECD